MSTEEGNTVCEVARTSCFCILFRTSYVPSYVIWNGKFMQKLFHYGVVQSSRENNFFLRCKSWEATLYISFRKLFMEHFIYWIAL